MTLRRRQHDLRPPDQLARRVAVDDQSLELGTAKVKADVITSHAQGYDTPTPLGITCQVTNTSVLNQTKSTQYLHQMLRSAQRRPSQAQPALGNLMSGGEH